MDELQREVYEVMTDLRPLVVARIEEWVAASPKLRARPEGVPLTTGFCRGIAAGVEEVLRQQFPDCVWRIASGYGVEYCTDTPPNLSDFADLEFFPGGMVNQAGEWHGHFWVCGGDPDREDGLIIDLSADQFGHEDVVVTELDDPRYRENSLLATDAMVRLTERGWGICCSRCGGWHNRRRDAVCCRQP